MASASTGLHEPAGRGEHRTCRGSGPSASLYGRGDPGGTINIVSKRPQLDSFARLDLSAGRWDRYRSALDVNTPLDEDGNVLYRMNIAVEDNKSFRDHRESERQFVAPSFSWELSPDTRLLVQAEVVRNRQTFDRGWSHRAATRPGVPLGLLWRTLRWSDQQRQRNAAGRTRTRPQRGLDTAPGQSLQAGRMDGYATEAAAVAADGRTLSRNLRYRDYDWQDAITQLELHGRVDTGSIEHQLLIGTEYERYALSEFMLRSDNLRSIDLYNPVYGSPRPAFNPARTVDRNELVHNRALNLQDQMRLTDKLFGVVGPVTTITSSARQRGERPASRADARKITPRVGVLYQLLPEVGLFANASQSFKPNNGAAASGATFDPKRAWATRRASNSTCSMAVWA